MAKPKRDIDKPCVCACARVYPRANVSAWRKGSTNFGEGIHQPGEGPARESAQEVRVDDAEINPDGADPSMEAKAFDLQGGGG